MRPDYCPIGGEPCQSVCAEPCSVAKKATPHELLIGQLLDSRIPKTEREHAAAREIERLRHKTPDPAAWINFNAATGERNVSFECESELASIPLWPEPPRPQRTPLSNGEIYTAYIEATNQTLRAQDERLALAFARAIEAAHGITNQETK